MMNFKKAFEAANSHSFSTVSPRNIALRVHAYDLTARDPSDHFVTGLDLYTQQVVSVRLRPLDNPLNSGRTRPELKDIANASERKTHVVAAEGDNGGVIIFQDCRPSGSQSFTANWANAAIHNGLSKLETIEKGYTTIVLAAGRFDPRNPSAELRNTAFTRQAKLSSAQLFANGDLQAMKEFMLRCLECKEGNGRYRPEFILRYIDQSSGSVDVDSALYTSHLTKNDEDMYVNAPAQESLDAFLSSSNDSTAETPKHYIALQELIAFMQDNPTIPAEEFSVEVIPVIRRSFGSNKRKDFFSLNRYTNGGETFYRNERSERGDAYFKRFHKPTDVKRPIKLWVPAYVATLAATQEVMKGGVPQLEMVDYRFVKDVTTFDVFASGYEQSYLPTKHFAFDDKLVERYDAARSDDGTHQLGQSSQTDMDIPTSSVPDHGNVHGCAPAQQAEPVMNSRQLNTKLPSLDDHVLDDLHQLIRQ